MQEEASTSMYFRKAESSSSPTATRDRLSTPVALNYKISNLDCEIAQLANTHSKLKLQIVLDASTMRPYMKSVIDRLPEYLTELAATFSPAEFSVTAYSEYFKFGYSMLHFKEGDNCAGNAAEEQKYISNCIRLPWTQDIELIRRFLMGLETYEGYINLDNSLTAFKEVLIQLDAEAEPDAANVVIHLANGPEFDTITDIPDEYLLQEKLVADSIGAELVLPQAVVDRVREAGNLAYFMISMNKEDLYPFISEFNDIFTGNGERREEEEEEGVLMIVKQSMYNPFERRKRNNKRRVNVRFDMEKNTVKEFEKDYHLGGAAEWYAASCPIMEELKGEDIEWHEVLESDTEEEEPTQSKGRRTAMTMQFYPSSSDEEKDCVMIVERHSPEKVEIRLGARMQF